MENTSWKCMSQNISWYRSRKKGLDDEVCHLSLLPLKEAVLEPVRVLGGWEPTV